jgi:hypothetical protein
LALRRIARSFGSAAGLCLQIEVLLHLFGEFALEPAALEQKHQFTPQPHKLLLTLFG